MEHVHFSAREASLLLWAFARGRYRKDPVFKYLTAAILDIMDEADYTPEIRLLPQVRAQYKIYSSFSRFFDLTLVPFFSFFFVGCRIWRMLHGELHDIMST